MRKHIGQLLRNLAYSGNRDAYIIAIFAIGFSFLNFFGVASPPITTAINLAAVGLILLGVLNLQGKLSELTEQVSDSARVARTIDEVVYECSRVVCNPENKHAQIYVYKGNEVTMHGHRRWYYDKTIEGLRQGFIGGYCRLDTLRSS